MLRLVMPEAKTLRYSIEAISNLIDEGSFKISENGIYMRAMDPSRIAYIELQLSRDSFETIEVDEEVSVGLNLGELKKRFSAARPSDYVEISMDKGFFVIKFKGKGTTTFKLPIIEIEEEDVPVPNLTFRANAKLRSSALKEGVKKVGIVSDTIKFILTRESVSMVGESDLGEVEFLLERGDEDLISLEVEEEAKASYTLSYIEDVVKATAASEVVSISLNTDHPLRMEFFISGDAGRMIFLLAPRIEQ